MSLDFSFFTFHFSETLQRWYDEHKRTLPWRDVTSPYHVWVSEIILQQTLVAQGYDYYLRFVRRFPDVITLAEASVDDVMNQWQGLGYYSRARNLHAAAKIIAAASGGKRDFFPTTYAEVRALPGVGDYTAAAICSFAYNQPRATVDGNVYRVLARFFAIDTPIDTTRGKREFAELATKLLDAAHPAVHNQALMDFGALQCTPASPHCDDCPFRQECRAHLLGASLSYPVKSKRTTVRSRYFLYVFFASDGKTLLRRRPAGDIWQGLYEPPLLELDAPINEAKAIELIREKAGLRKHRPPVRDTPACSATATPNLSTTDATSVSPDSVSIIPLRRGVKHQLTHQTIYADLYYVNALPATDFFAVTHYRRVPLATLGDYPVSRLVEQLLAAIQEAQVFSG